MNPLDVKGLAAAIGQVLGDEGLRGEMREKGLAQATRFSWKRTVEEILALYQQRIK